MSSYARATSWLETKRPRFPVVAARQLLGRYAGTRVSSYADARIHAERKRGLCRRGCCAWPEGGAAEPPSRRADTAGPVEEHRSPPSVPRVRNSRLTAEPGDVRLAAESNARPYPGPDVSRQMACGRTSRCGSLLRRHGTGQARRGAAWFTAPAARLGARRSACDPSHAGSHGHRPRRVRAALCRAHIQTGRLC